MDHYNWLCGDPEQVELAERFNSLSPNIHIWILQTELYTFP